MSKRYSRRQFMQQCSWTGLLWTGTTIAACQNTEKSAQDKSGTTQEISCDDLSHLSAEELKPRETFGYVKESPISESQCDNCKLWLPIKNNEDCGKCLLFKGPVYAAGYCTYWAPQM